MRLDEIQMRLAQDPPAPRQRIQDALNRLSPKDTGEYRDRLQAYLDYLEKGLEVIVLKALSKQQKQRYASARHLANALSRLCRETGTG